MDAASLSVTCPCQKCALAAGRSDGDPNHEHVEGRMDVPMRSFFAGKFSIDICWWFYFNVIAHECDRRNEKKGGPKGTEEAVLFSPGLTFSCHSAFGVNTIKIFRSFFCSWTSVFIF